MMLETHIEKVPVDYPFVYQDLYDTAVDFYLALSDYEENTGNNWNCLLLCLADLQDELKISAEAAENAASEES